MKWIKLHVEMHPFVKTGLMHPFCSEIIKCHSSIHAYSAITCFIVTSVKPVQIKMNLSNLLGFMLGDISVTLFALKPCYLVLNTTISNPKEVNK